MNELWKLLAGLGIFLFGMYLLEEAIKALSGRSFKKLIKNYTSNRIKSILAGTFSTAILQSSSAVSLIVIAFVGAGIMNMINAMGVIVGSNLGTTVTSWIVASLGFKFSIESIALPIIAVGGLVLIFLGKTGKYANISKLLVGFGFIFMGLDYIKVSVSDLVENVPLEYLRDRNFFIYILAGFVLTALVQSSSAAMALILTAVSSSMLGFEEACAMVIGTNIGTTTTVIIGTFGATTSMKRVAFSHFFFNLITAIAAIALFYPLTQLIIYNYPTQQDPVIALAIFHTAFNLLGVIVFTPFIGIFSRFIKKIYPEKKAVYTQFIHSTLPNFPEASINAFKNEANYLYQLVMHHNLKALYIDETLVLNPLYNNDGNKINMPKEVSQTYLIIKELQSELFDYASQLQENELSPEDADFINRILHSVRYAVSSTKTMKDYQHEFEDLYNSDNASGVQYYQYFRQALIAFYLKIKELNEQTEAAQMIPILHQMAKNIRLENEDFSQTIIKKLAKRELPTTLVNNVLSAQRGFSQSERQIVLCFKDFLLTNEEAKIFEGFENQEL